MSEAVSSTIPLTLPDRSPARPNLDAGMGARSAVLFVGIVAIGLFFIAYNVWDDVQESGAHATTWVPFLLLGVALLVALGFEFVNGFHDTANAVATVIYTHSLPASRRRRLVGCVQFSRGAGVERRRGLRHHGPPARRTDSAGRLQRRVRDGVRAVDRRDHLESRHLVFRAAGVELAHADRFDHRCRPGESDDGSCFRGQRGRLGAGDEGRRIRSCCRRSSGSALRRCCCWRSSSWRRVRCSTASRRAPRPPPWWIRAILILTCTGVSFAHGSNDGQKGMGLIMLILIGVVPTAYALNRAAPDSYVQPFVLTSTYAAQVLDRGQDTVIDNPRQVIGDYLRTRQADPRLGSALAQLARDIQGQIERHGSLRRLPAEAVQNVRNDMYLEAESIRRITKDRSIAFAKADVDVLNVYRTELDGATRFIPIWVKVAVAIALGLGTMVGWKRIVITVGEKIGKSHLTYAQGASAELVAATTIAAADLYGLPVSTTQVLSSGVAGTMAANRSGLQMSTVRNMAMAWVLTLPVAVVLSGSLFWVFSKLF